MFIKVGAEVAYNSASTNVDTKEINDNETSVNTSLPFVGSKTGFTATSGAQTVKLDPRMNIIIIVLMASMV